MIFIVPKKIKIIDIHLNWTYLTWLPLTYLYVCFIYRHGINNFYFIFIKNNYFVWAIIENILFIKNGIYETEKNNDKYVMVLSREPIVFQQSKIIENKREFVI